MAPEFYECVTIFFSDIVGFTAISGILQPHEVSCSLESLATLLCPNEMQELWLEGWVAWQGLTWHDQMHVCMSRGMNGAPSDALLTLGLTARSCSFICKNERPVQRHHLRQRSP